MNTFKTFKIDFLQAQFGPGNEKDGVWELLSSLAPQKALPVHGVRGIQYQIRDLNELAGGHALKGVFAKFRHTDIPHIGSEEGGERDIEMHDDEGLLEKNHFLFYKRWQLLVWQRNGHAGKPDRFAEYLTNFSSETISVNPAYEPNAMSRLLKGENQIREVDVRLARPTNSELYRSNNSTPDDDLIGLLADSGAMKVRMGLKANGYSKKPKERFLPRKLKSMMSRLMKRDDIEVEKAVVVVEDDLGDSHPIDLVIDKLTSRQDVLMMGRYPDKASVQKALIAARDENMDSLRELFGEGDTQLT